MKHHLLFFIAVVIVIANAVYWPMNRIYRHYSLSEAGNEAGRILSREADLVEHFCLSRYAPAPGRSAIPVEWEKALGSKIRLREGVGEVVSEAAELQSRVEEIRNLSPGQELLHVTLSKPQYYVIVRRPVAAPNQLLFISKTDENLQELTGRHFPFNPAVIAVIVALAAALMLTVLRAILPK